MSNIQVFILAHVVGNFNDLLAAWIFLFCSKAGEKNAFMCTYTHTEAVKCFALISKQVLINYREGRTRFEKAVLFPADWLIIDIHKVLKSMFLDVLLFTSHLAYISVIMMSSIALQSGYCSAVIITAIKSWVFFLFWSSQQRRKAVSIRFFWSLNHSSKLCYRTPYNCHRFHDNIAALK